MKTPPKQKNNLIRDKSFSFALDAIDLYTKLVDQREYVISKQFLKSATSIGANIEESLAAHSRKDFIAKMVIASKEARETRYWLNLLQKTPLTNLNMTPLIDEIENILNILLAIIKSSRRNAGL